MRSLSLLLLLLLLCYPRCLRCWSAKQSRVDAGLNHPLYCRVSVTLGQGFWERFRRTRGPSNGRHTLREELRKGIAYVNGRLGEERVVVEAAAGMGKPARRQLQLQLRAQRDVKIDWPSWGGIFDVTQKLVQKLNKARGAGRGGKAKKGRRSKKANEHFCLRLVLVHTKHPIDKHSPSSKVHFTQAMGPGEYGVFQEGDF